MERRKILLGSGVALATALAGCSSTETDEDVPDDSGDDAGTDDSGGAGSDDGSDDAGDDGETDDSGDDGEELPGVDGVTDVSSEHLSVIDVSHNPDSLEVYVDSKTTDTEKLHKEMKYVADDLSKAVVDRDTFKSEIDSIKLVTEHEDKLVFKHYVEVTWLLKYLDGELTKEELHAKILDTKY